MTITILSACGTGESSAQNAITIKSSGINALVSIIDGLLNPGNSTGWGGFSWELAKGVDQTKFTPKQIPYPAAGFFLGLSTTYLQSVATGVANGARMIQNLNGGQFILTGYSQGAQVVSMLLQELQTGALTAYLPQLVAGVTFGNPMRNPGHSWPNDPTGCNTGQASAGQGINSYTTSSGTLSATAGVGLLASPPSTWWDMTNQYDLAGNIPVGTGSGGDIIADVWTAAGGASLTSVPQIVNIFANVLNGDLGDPLAEIIHGFLTNGLSEGADLTAAIGFLANAVTKIATLGHTSFGTALIGQTGLTAVQLAIQYINSFAA